ncbi:MAG TPA: GGDEF domain-containing protein [Dehalococcoidia bacterium]|jgi:diguanylate cyclase (GGDEF)-like protein|nr:GGDEF domain-containing protein [Dehalococcoidia bacterium]
MGTNDAADSADQGFYASLLSSNTERGEALRYADEDAYDAAYVTMITAFRWIILATYLVMVLSGAMTVNTLALIGSAGWIALTNVIATWTWRQKRPVPWYDAVYLYMDLMSVMVVVLATANLSYPTWLAFVILMVQSPSARSTRAATIYNITCLASFALCIAVLTLSGWYSVRVGTTIVTLVMLTLIGVHLSIMFDGNRRMWWIIRMMAITDSLTGLSNRRQFSRYMADPPTQRSLALILIDVDRFKEFNDEFGHLAGDKLLVDLASVLNRVFPDAMTIARYGGDEFVILLPCRAMEQAEQRVDALLGVRPGERLPVSVGIAMWPDHHPTLDAAFAAADDCLRTAKRAQRGSYATWRRDGRIEVHASESPRV